MSRQPIAVVGDTHNCPIHGPNAISAGGVRIIDKKPVARIGDPCDCGAVIVDGSSRVTDQGKFVALNGSTTSCGGVIVVGGARMRIPK